MTKREAHRLALLVIWHEINGSLDTSDEWARHPENDEPFSRADYEMVRDAGRAWFARFEARLPRSG